MANFSSFFSIVFTLSPSPTLFWLSLVKRVFLPSVYIVHSSIFSLMTITYGISNNADSSPSQTAAFCSSASSSYIKVVHSAFNFVASFSNSLSTASSCPSMAAIISGRLFEDLSILKSPISTYKSSVIW